MNILRIKKAQALLELAIFGSILIMLLGIILNYGLRYNFEQKTSMSAFRKALEMSTNDATGNQGSVTLVTDKHIPNPSNPFAVGSVMPFMSSASVVRNYRMNETADTIDELPKTTYIIAGQKYTYNTASFKTESSVPQDKFEKYKEVYGDNNVWETGTGDCIRSETVTEGYYLPGSGPGGGPGTIYVPPVGQCVEWSKNIKIIDSCEGEIINFDSCKRQCRMITEPGLCVRECEKGKEPGSSKDCSAVCNQPMQGPWYCSAGTLENIFNFAIAKSKPKTMGLQPDYAKQTAMSSSLRKQEGAGVITTTDTINWSDTTTRAIVYNQRIYNPAGSVEPGINIQQVPVSSTLGETATQTCRDGVCQ